MAIVALSVPVGTSGYCAAIGFGWERLMQASLLDCASEGQTLRRSHEMAVEVNDVDGFMVISWLWCCSGKRMEGTKVNYI